MQLQLNAIEYKIGGETYLYRQSLCLQNDDVTVLLGATLAGKTTLLRIMAGLDRPTRGRVLAGNQDVTGVSVRKRDVAMVYQQFINYPSLTVYENIASPLRLQRAQGIDQRVRSLARQLHIEAFLSRYPQTLSGGQQQRVALARALAKNASLLLCDEPLVNLDYKLRESLRDELSELFARGESTVVYATTDPMEALMLGGYTAVLDRGELLQYGPSAEVFHQPVSLRVARAFSDPPMNLIAVQRQTPAGLCLPDGSVVAWDLPRACPLQLTLAMRADTLRLRPSTHSLPVHAKVMLVEISGSNTFLHLDSALGALVAQLPGVHTIGIEQAITVHIDTALVYLFDAQGSLLMAPRMRSKVSPGTPQLEETLWPA